MMTVLHVIFGTFVLVVAPAALFARKGGRWHRRWGKAFMAAMAMVLFTAGFMWQPKGHIFLLALSFVSAFYIFNGFRVILRRKRRREDALDNGVDIGAAVVTILAAIWLFWIAATPPDKLMRSLSPIMAGLGGIAIAFALNDLRGIFGPRSRNGTLLAHMTAMIAAYISAVTAFVVINAHGVPMQLRWIVPISIGTIVISIFATPYRLPKMFPLKPKLTTIFVRAKH